MATILTESGIADECHAYLSAYFGGITSDEASKTSFEFWTAKADGASQAAPAKKVLFGRRS